jgi:hypothetical protein
LNSALLSCGSIVFHLLRERAIMPYIEDLVKCKKDFSYFCSNFLKHSKFIQMPIVLLPHQERLYHHIEENPYTIGKKFRQGGFSTLMNAYALWKCMFFENIDFLILSCSYQQSQHLKKQILIFLELMPILNPKIKISFGPSSSIKFPSTNSSINFLGINSEFKSRYNYLYIDEAAFMKELEEKWNLFSFIPHIIMLSTISKQSNLFNKIYLNAYSKKNNFKIFECNYKELPKYDDAFIKEMKNNLGEEAFAQEIEAKFPIPIETLVDLMNSDKLNKEEKEALDLVIQKAI